jgi:hypothetical protein
LKEWHSAVKKSGVSQDPDTLEYNLTLHRLFFQQLGCNAGQVAKMGKSRPNERRGHVTALSQMHNFVDLGFLPLTWVRWKVINNNDDDDGMDQMKSYDDDQESDDK